MRVDPRKILLTGAAGYIGGATAIILQREGFIPVGIDARLTSSLSPAATFLCKQADLTDLTAAREALRSLCNNGIPGAVIHFAALALVGESCEQPARYFKNNITATLNVAELMAEFGIPIFVHSSSCAIYGVPKALPICEQADPAPISVYGETKRTSEEIFNHMAIRYRFRGIHLRYFNPAAALEDLSWGENHDPETHLIPLAVAAGLLSKALSIYGKHHPTADGTCIRDFIHIEDLVYAHVSALKALMERSTPTHTVLNIGSGQGSSVLEVVRSCEHLLGKSIAVDWQDARPGDPAILVADISKAGAILKWRPKRSLIDIISTQIEWTKSRQLGHQ